MLTILMSLLLASSVAPQADASGKWEGTIKAIRSDGTPHEDTLLMILQQKDTTVTGTVGESESDQHRITSGTMDGNRLTLTVVTDNGREYRAELTIAGDDIAGEVTSGPMRADLQARRRKE